MEEINDNQTKNDQITNTQVIKEKEVGEKLEKSYPFFILLSLGFGFLFMYSFYDFEENFNGIFYFVFVVGLFVSTWIALSKLNLVNDFKEDKTPYIYGSMGIVLGLSTILTSNGFFIFFNTIAIAFIYGIFVVKFLFPKKRLALLTTIGYYIKIFFITIFYVYLPFKHFRSFFKNKKINLEKHIPIIKGVLFALLFLSVIIPLLITSDMIISTLFGDLFVGLELSFIYNFRKVILWIIGASVFYGLICNVTEDNGEDLDGRFNKKEPVTMITMTWIVAIIYILFSFMQVYYLVGGKFFTLPAGLTYAEYARSGFFQLLAVAAINLILVLFCINNIMEHKFLNMSLKVISASTFIMIASSAYRMILYIHAYHLTFIRVLVLWFLLVLSICMGGIVYSIYKKNFYIYKFLFLTFTISYIIFGFAKVDYHIARYNIGHMEEIKEKDISYLLNLSHDAAPALLDIRDEQILTELAIDEGYNDYDGYDLSYQIDSKTRIKRYFDDIVEGYDSTIRGFNVSRWRAYKAAGKYVR